MFLHPDKISERFVMQQAIKRLLLMNSSSRFSLSFNGRKYEHKIPVNLTRLSPDSIP
jgi:hypothetical protein